MNKAQSRYEKTPYLKFYSTVAWQRLRARKLRVEPLCRFCKEQGILTEGTHVDHIKPHKGDWGLFMEWGNLQTLCAECHNGVKQRIEKSGEFGCDVNGIVPGWK